MSKDKENVKNVIDLKKYLNVYSFEFELPGSGETLKYKPITIGQMKQLLSYGNKNRNVIENGLDKLISTSVENEDFDVKNLYLNDRIALLVELRKATKGTSYSFIKKCPECGSDIIVQMDLNELTIDKKKEDIDKSISFSNSISVEVDYIKRKDQSEVTDYVYKNRKSSSEDEKEIDMAILTLASSIKKIILPDGNVIEEPTINDKEMLINSLNENDYQKFIDWFDENKFGFDFKYRILCDACNLYEEEINIPIEDFFL